MILFLLGIVGLLAGGFFVAVSILQHAVTYLNNTYHVSVVAISPTEAIFTILNLDLTLVFTVLLPFILLGLAAYLAPALYPKERQYLWYIPTAYVLAALGAVFGWFLTSKVFIPYFQNFSAMLNIQNLWSLDQLLAIFFVTITACILVFQVPIAVVVLFNLKIIKLENLNSIRKVVFLLAIVAGAVITPTPDMITQLIVALPFYLLFELAVIYIKLTRK